LHSKRAKHSETKGQKKIFFFKLGRDQFRPGENTPRLSEKFIAWAKVVQRARFIFAWAKILLPGREYLIALAKDFSPKRKHSTRLGECTLAWANYFLAWAKTVQRAYLLLKTILAWARWCRLGELCRKINNIHYIRVTMNASYD